MRVQAQRRNRLRFLQRLRNLSEMPRKSIYPREYLSGRARGEFNRKMPLLQRLFHLFRVLKGVFIDR